VLGGKGTRKTLVREGSSGRKTFELVMHDHEADHFSVYEIRGGSGERVSDKAITTGALTVKQPVANPRADQLRSEAAALHAKADAKMRQSEARPWGNQRTKSASQRASASHRHAAEGVRLREQAQRKEREAARADAPEERAREVLRSLPAPRRDLTLAQIHKRDKVPHERRVKERAVWKRQNKDTRGVIDGKHMVMRGGTMHTLRELSDDALDALLPSGH